jgi:chorismate-pyruvate lyase
MKMSYTSMKIDTKKIPFPLDHFYNEYGEDQPEFEEIPLEEIPDPEHDLLCHKDNMTPTLENFYRATSYLAVKRKYFENGYLYRHIVLHDEYLNPMEIGAIQIHLHNFPLEVREEITQCKTPLGRIITSNKIINRNRPQVFYRIISDSYLSKIFDLSEPTVLYGRLNYVLNEHDKPLAVALEILPPLHRDSERWK